MAKSFGVGFLLCAQGVNRVNLTCSGLSCPIVNYIICFPARRFCDGSSEITISVYPINYILDRLYINL